MTPKTIAQFGRVVAALGGMIFLGGAGAWWLQSDFDQSMLPAFAALTGLALGAGGYLTFRRADEESRRVKGMSPEQLRHATENRELGFWICTRCMILMPVNYTGDCLACLSSVGTVEVKSEEDRKIALACLEQAG